ncbi:electron transport complex subunit E [Chitinibacteraceae bacterium HSL-7]
MTRDDVMSIVRNGLWTQNAGLVQLLGLCPLLVISNSVVNALSLGLATTLVMVISGWMIALLKPWIPRELRAPAFILVIAALVTVVDLLFAAYAYGLYQVLGIFIPLITTNCIVLARAEAYASRNGRLAATLDGLMMGLGLTLTLVALGAVREVFGRGMLFGGFDLLLGPWAAQLTIHLADHAPLLIMALPPGAFVGLALLIAAKNLIDARQAARAKPVIQIAEPEAAQP